MQVQMGRTNEVRSTVIRPLAKKRQRRALALLHVGIVAGRICASAS